MSRQHADEYTGMWDFVLVIAGLVFLVLMMALVINPPEAWIKRTFLKRPDR